MGRAFDCFPSILTCDFQTNREQVVSPLMLRTLRPNRTDNCFNLLEQPKTSTISSRTLTFLISPMSSGKISLCHRLRSYLGWSILATLKFTFLNLGQLSRYPDGLGWQLKVQKTIVRKSPEFKKFQDFLVYETDMVGSCLKFNSNIVFTCCRVGEYISSRSCQHDPSSCSRRGASPQSMPLFSDSILSFSASLWI